MNKKIRYCRYCKKRLDGWHHFFCGDKCMEKYAEEYVPSYEMVKVQEILRQWYEESEDVKKRIIPTCKICKHKCKIKIREVNFDTIFSFSCLNFEKKK